MNYTETLLVLVIAIEFILVFAFVVFTYISRFFWSQVSDSNTKKAEILRKEIYEALKEGKSKALSFPSRIDLIIPIFYEIENGHMKSEAWEAIRNDMIKKQLLPATRDFVNKRSWLKQYYLCLLFDYYFEPQDENAIVKLVKTKVPIVLINAVRVAVKFDSKKTLYAVIERIESERRVVQQMLIAEAFQTPKLLSLCSEILQSSQDAFMHKTCFVLLDKIGPTPEFFELAKRDIESRALELKLNAMRVLAKSDPARALPILRDFLDSPIWQVREVALSLLAPIQDSESFEKISKMLTDPVWWVRYRAGLTLLEFKTKGPAMLEKISKSSPDKYAALEAQFILFRHNLQEKS